MILFKANGRCAAAVSDEKITSGSVGIQVTFQLSAVYDDLAALAVFRGSGAEVSVILPEPRCTVPPEVLAEAGGSLLIGVYARDGEGRTAVPTVWANAGTILGGATPDLPETPPTPEWTAQVELAVAEAVERSEEALEKASAVEEEGARQVQAVQEAGAEATEAVGSAQAAAVQAVQTESGTQQDAVQAKGEEVLASIPADYTALAADIAPAFSTTVDYRVNHYVMYNGKVYRFKRDHPAGAWVSGDVEAATAASAWRDLTPLALAQGNVPAIAGTTEAHIDLNDFTAPGNYKVTSVANAKTIDNMPTSNPQAGRLIVFLASSSAAVVQIYLMHASSHPLIYVRNKTSSGWNPWERLLTSAYVDTAPTEGSDHPISSGAVYEALNAMTAAEGAAW